MAKSAHYSHTALSGVLSSGRLPSLDLTLAFVRACGGDESQWRGRWHKVSSHMSTDDGQPVPSQPAHERRHRRWLITAAAASLVAATGAGVAMTMMDSGGTSVPPADSKPRLAQQVSCRERPDPGDRPRIACDDSKFVADITIPDGTTVRAGQRFVKTWEIRNTGLIPWRGRFLQRQGILSGQGLCSSPARVPVPITMPGQDALISVTFTAPNLPGSCRVDFKMTDKDGTLYFPYLGGLYIVVNVTG